MKLGYLTHFNEDELKIASSIGFDGLEVHISSWPQELRSSANGRKEISQQIRELSAKYNITITAIASYASGIRPAEERIAHYREAIELASLAGINVVTTLTGGDPDKDLDENIKLFKEIFTEVAKIAEDKGVKIAFENWPGLGAYPPIKSVNFGFHPNAWQKMFDAVPSKALGLEFDPSHLVWQNIDYIAQVKLFGSRIYHVHLKDTEIFEGTLAEVGIFGRGWWRYRIPGFGIVNWAEFISALREVGFDGGCAIEHEDPVFSGERRTEGLKLGYNHLKPLIV
jgi:sugar phosphate isomerase/epimerase